MCMANIYVVVWCVDFNIIEFRRGEHEYVEQYLSPLFALEIN